jgi:hypothetical protein
MDPYYPIDREIDKVQKELSACHLDSSSLKTASLPVEKCMKGLSDLVGELTKPLATAHPDNLKYLEVPSYLQDAKLAALIDSRQIGEAQRYIEKTIAKKPGVPKLFVEAFEGTVSPPGGPGADRLVVKVTNPDGTIKWVNFAVLGPDQDGAANNISIVTHAANGASYFQDWRRTTVGQSVSVNMDTSRKNCLFCHIQGYNSFPASHRMQWSGVLDKPGRLQKMEDLYAPDKGRFKPMGDDGKLIDVSKLGPGMGSGAGLEARRSNEFMDSCFDSVRESADKEDQKYKAELDKLVANRDLYQASKNRVKSFMKCGSCHNNDKLGTLPFPVGFIDGRGAKNKRFHLQRIYDGSMPADDYSGELTDSDRRVLATCLFKEQYGIAPNQPRAISLDQLKTGRFYQFFSDVDCTTGLSKSAGGNVFLNMTPERQLLKTISPDGVR